ncbi:MAG TPA: hypothetical protein VIH93_15730 [Thermoanaerobaculia bacterium]
MDEPPAADAAVEAARRARAEQEARVAQAARSEPRPIPPAVPDPIRFCVWTTVALLAWAFSPPLVAAVFAAAGLAAYVRAYRRGLRQSDCILRDVRLVMLYLGLVAAIGLAAAGWRLWAIWHPR